MKYVSMIALALLVFSLQGCDTTAETNIGGDALNQPDNDLDPDDDFNIVAYFYTDRPVVGLQYSCTRSGTIPITGETDAKGSFVCPRDRRVTFSVGTPNHLQLGSVDLEIYGKRAPLASDGSDNGEADARENVTITPSTLHGSTADSDNDLVANIFQLLYLLDVSTAPATGVAKQDVLLLTPEVHAMFSPLAGTVVLDQNVNDFTVYAGAIKGAAENSAPPLELRSEGIALNPGSESSELSLLVDGALVAVRAGLYRVVSMLGYEYDGNTAQKRFNGSLGMLVGRNGQSTGMGYSWITDFSPPNANYFATMAMSSGTLDADGLLDNIVFGSLNGDVRIDGRMVNDRLYAAVGLLDPAVDANYKIPYTYSPSSADVGVFTTGAIEDELSMYRQFETQPDVDLGNLPADYLPREFGLGYRDYPDGTQVTDVQRDDPGYGGDLRLLRFRVLANGDIVSVTEGYQCDQPDFSEVSDVAGQYQRADGQQEAVIGQAGSVFTSAGRSYMSILLAIYDPTHPDYGFQFGTPALDGVNLDPVVIDVLAAELYNKYCDPAVPDCNRYLEWFNTSVFYEDIVGPLILDAGAIPDPDTANELLRKPDYYGRVVDLVDFTAESCTP